MNNTNNYPLSRGSRTPQTNSNNPSSPIQQNQTQVRSILPAEDLRLRLEELALQREYAPSSSFSRRLSVSSPEPILVTPPSSPAPDVLDRIALILRAEGDQHAANIDLSKLLNLKTLVMSVFSFLGRAQSAPPPRNCAEEVLRGPAENPPLEGIEDSALQATGILDSAILTTRARLQQAIQEERDRVTDLEAVQSLNSLTETLNSMTLSEHSDTSYLDNFRSGSSQDECHSLLVESLHSLECALLSSLTREEVKDLEGSPSPEEHLGAVGGLPYRVITQHRRPGASGVLGTLMMAPDQNAQILKAIADGDVCCLDDEDDDDFIDTSEEPKDPRDFDTHGAISPPLPPLSLLDFSSDLSLLNIPPLETTGVEGEIDTPESPTSSEDDFFDDVVLSFQQEKK